jgi:hypothetical protein
MCPEIVHRIRQLLDLQIRTTMSALHAPYLSALWRDYEAREVEIRTLFDELEQDGSTLESENKGLNPSCVSEFHFSG